MAANHHENDKLWSPAEQYTSHHIEGTFYINRVSREWRSQEESESNKRSMASEADRQTRSMASEENVRRGVCWWDCTLNNQYLHCTYVNKHVFFINPVLSFANNQLVSHVVGAVATAPLQNKSDLTCLFVCLFVGLFHVGNWNFWLFRA